MHRLDVGGSKGLVGPCEQYYNNNKVIKSFQIILSYDGQDADNLIMFFWYEQRQHLSEGKNIKLFH